jgi:hypothetical protein
LGITAFIFQAQPRIINGGASAGREPTGVPSRAQQRASAQHDAQQAVAERRSAKGAGGGGSWSRETVEAHVDNETRFASQGEFDCTFNAHEANGARLEKLRDLLPAGDLKDKVTAEYVAHLQLPIPTYQPPMKKARAGGAGSAGEGNGGCGENGYTGGGVNGGTGGGEHGGTGGGDVNGGDGGWGRATWDMTEPRLVPETAAYDNYAAVENAHGSDGGTGDINGGSGGGTGDAGGGV